MLIAWEVGHMNKNSTDSHKADNHIAAVSSPRMDPVYGANGPLQAHWEIGRENKCETR